MTVLLLICFLGNGRILANGGDATCVPHCTVCNSEKRCLDCEEDYHWIEGNCVEECYDIDDPLKPWPLQASHDNNSVGTLGNDVGAQYNRDELLKRIVKACAKRVEDEKQIMV